MELKIQEVNFINPYSILIVTPKKMVRLFCPFQVQVIRSVDSLEPDQVLTVRKVMTSHDRMLMYLIGSKAYHYHHFMIIA